jgi:hypothetical protein
MDNSILIIKYDTIYNNTTLFKHFAIIFDTFSTKSVTWKKNINTDKLTDTTFTEPFHVK